MVPNDLKELMDGFVSETLDNLDDNEIRISRLSEPDSIDHIEAIFRVFHTLKGLSGFFELYVIQKVTHTAETLLDLLRTNPKPVSNETVDLLYVVFDFLQNALKSAGENYTDELYLEESNIILEQLYIKTEEFKITLDTNQISTIEITPNDNALQFELSGIEDDEMNKVMEEFFVNLQVFIRDFKSYSKKLSISYNPDLLNKISKQLSTLKANSSLLDLKSVNMIVKEIDNIIDYYKLEQSELTDDSSSKLNEAVNYLDNILEIIIKNHSDSEFSFEAEKISLLLKQVNRDTYMINNSGSIPMNIIVGETTNSTENGVDSHQLEILFSKIEADESDYKAVNSLLEILNSLSVSDIVKTNSELNDIVQSTITIVESVANKEIEAGDIISIIKSDIKILCNFINSESNNNSNTKATPIEKSEPVTNLNVKLQKSISEANDIVEKQTPKDFIKPENDKVVMAERKEVRVSTDKLNKLFDLVGEIITIESMVVNNKNLEGLRLPDFQIASGMLNKLIRELQKITMSIRMIPLEGLFNKMSRLVRDLSRKFDKNIQLEIYGQDTEMDKNVIEQLSDPLVHMIRNSIDHGIENEHARLDAGKSNIGKIILGASYQGNEIHITVEDDGAGLNRQKIIEKAQARGLFMGNPAELTDKQVWQFVFEPGLSTAKEVTDVSGRGVGMDVVKKNIEKLRGSIDIESRTGFGTKITFRIPLTLAIMDAMLIRVGNTKYALPILSVRESFQPKKQDITITMDGIEVVKVRNELYPVIRLHELMRREPDNDDLEKGILMMLSSHEKKVCLFVDEILGQQQAVVKPLSEYIGDVEGITGCMVMADGKIGLILDVESLLQKAEKFIK